MWFQVVQVCLLSSQCGCVRHSGDCREGRRASRGSVRDVFTSREVQQKVPQEIFEVIQPIPQERVAERNVEHIVDVPVPQIQEQIVEMVKVIPQEGFAERMMEQIVDVPVPQVMEETVEVAHSIPMERIPERVGEQIVDMQEPQVMEKITKVPKSTQQVANTPQIVSRQDPATNRRTSCEHACPASRAHSCGEHAQNPQGEKSQIRRPSKSRNSWR